MKISCPICGKKAEWEENRFRPFCSERCKLIDLGQWASDVYRVPGISQNDEDEAPIEETEPSGDRSGSNGDVSGNGKGKID